MLRKALLFISISLLAVFAWSSPVRAGFGISPPYVQSDKLIPGSHYEQRIRLLRSSAEDELTAVITVNAPEIESWISVQGGNTVTMPKDLLQVPMVINVDVPEDAALGIYRGHINVRVSSGAGAGPGGVSVALGARIDIELKVTDQSVPDFKIRSASVADFEEPGIPWRWPVFRWFLKRVKVNMTIENTGNVAVAPSKVHLEVYDISRRTLLEISDDTTFEQVPPYKTTSVEADFPTVQPPASYWAFIKVYKDNEVLHNYELTYTLYPRGEMPGTAPPLPKWRWALLSGFVMLALSILMLLVRIRIWWITYVCLYWLSWPLRMTGKGGIIAHKRIRLKFWKWIHKKAQKHHINQESADHPHREPVDSEKDNDII